MVTAIPAIILLRSATLVVKFESSRMGIGAAAAGRSADRRPRALASMGRSVVVPTAAVGTAGAAGTAGTALRSTGMVKETVLPGVSCPVPALPSVKCFTDWSATFRTLQNMRDGFSTVIAAEEEDRGNPGVTTARSSITGLLVTATTSPVTPTRFPVSSRLCSATGWVPEPGGNRLLEVFVPMVLA